MLLIIGIHSTSVTCYDSIYVIVELLPTCNIYGDLTVFSIPYYLELHIAKKFILLVF